MCEVVAAPLHKPTRKRALSDSKQRLDELLSRSAASAVPLNEER